MASMRVLHQRQEDLGYDCSLDSSESDSEIDSGCSQFYRHTAKVRFTRTTSNIQHHIAATTEANEGKQQLFGCLRRSSSTNQMSQYVERSLIGKKGDKTTSSCSISPESEKRRQELEKTRREVKRMDQLHMEQQQRQERTEGYRRNMSTTLGSSTVPSLSLQNNFVNVSPDSWITALSSMGESMESRSSPTLSRSPSSGNSSCCWDWCIGEQSSWPPHVDLEPFSGDPKDWPLFIQRFKTWIHDAMPNDTLRMIYLEELLSTDLRQKYSAYLSYPGRYRSLLVHLKNHYGHPLLVVRSCFEALQKLAPVNANNPELAVADLSSQIENILTILKMVGCEAEASTFSALELSGLVAKLSEELREEWKFYIKDRQSITHLPTLREFASWLHERAVESIW